MHDGRWNAGVNLRSYARVPFPISFKTKMILAGVVACWTA